MGPMEKLIHCQVTKALLTSHFRIIRHSEPYSRTEQLKHRVPHPIRVKHNYHIKAIILVQGVSEEVLRRILELKGGGNNREKEGHA